MKRLSYIIITLVICVPLFVMVGNIRNMAHKCERVIQTDTIIVRDTIRDTIPRYVTRYEIRKDTVFLPSADTLQEKRVVIPIEQVKYVSDEYLAIVEGYKPNLKYIEVYKKTEYITKYIEKTKKNRVSVGFQTGIGAGKNGFSPYVGIGIQYNLFGW